MRWILLVLTIAIACRTVNTRHDARAREILQIPESPSFVFMSSTAFAAMVTAYAAYCRAQTSAAGTCALDDFRARYNEVGARLWCTGNALVRFSAPPNSFVRDGGYACTVELATLRATCPGTSSVEDASDPAIVGSSAELFVAAMAARSEHGGVSHTTEEKRSLTEFRWQYKTVSVRTMGDGIATVRFYLRASSAGRAAIAYRINLATLKLVGVQDEP
jgi:hypothetical protein